MAQDRVSDHSPYTQGYARGHNTKEQRRAIVCADDDGDYHFTIQRLPAHVVSSGTKQAGCVAKKSCTGHVKTFHGSARIRRGTPDATVLPPIAMELTDPRNMLEPELPRRVHLSPTAGQYSTFAQPHPVGHSVSRGLTGRHWRQWPGTTCTPIPPRHARRKPCRIVAPRGTGLPPRAALHREYSRSSMR